MIRKSIQIVAAGLALVGLASPALADRKPSPDEFIKIVTVLAAAGYDRWDQIKLENGEYWDVDDARRRDGKHFDLKLSPNDYGIIEVNSD